MCVWCGLILIRYDYDASPLALVLDSFISSLSLSDTIILYVDSMIMMTFSIIVK